MRPLPPSFRFMSRVLVPALVALLSLGAAAQTPSPGGKSARQLGHGQRGVPPVKITGALDFGGLEVGVTSAPQQVTITNTSAASVTISAVVPKGPFAADFSVSGLPALPVALGAGQSLQADVAFTPSAEGAASGGIGVELTPPTSTPIGVGAVGLGYGPAGDEVRINSGGQDFQGLLEGKFWNEDFAFVGGVNAFFGGPVVGTPNKVLMRAQRIGAAFGYSLPLPDGPYEVTLHFVEMQLPARGTRVFDVAIDGQVVLDDLDLAGQIGFGVAHTQTFPVDVTGGELSIDLTAEIGLAVLSALEVRGQPRLEADATELQFGAVASLQSAQEVVTLTNTGLTPLTIDSLAFLVGPAGTPDAMSADLQGMVYDGDAGDVTHPVSVVLSPGASTPLTVTFAPVTDQYDQCTLRLAGDFGSLDLGLSGLGGHVGHPYLHPVIQDVAVLVDYDGGGTEEAILDGTLSHTHEPGKSLVAYDWTEGGSPIASGPLAALPFALGEHLVQLEIFDDNVPSESLAATTTVKVVSSSEVPGVLVRYYDASGGSPTAAQMMTNPPADADFAEVVPGMSIDGLTTIGSSPFSQDVLVRLTATIDIAAGGSYQLVPSGGSQRYLLLDGLGVVGPMTLTAGSHTLDARFVASAPGQGPFEVQIGPEGGSLGEIDAEVLAHDQSTLRPLITAMPGVGTSLGGNQITIEGLGFFPAASVVVHWGASILSGGALTSIAADEIELVSPPGSGVIQVTVETPNGMSNPVQFTYDQSGPVPINFTPLANVSVQQPTGGTWAPDGRFYVIGLHGNVTAFEFDDDYDVVSQQTYPGVSGLSNPDSLGITVSPFENGSPVRLYVAHGKHFVSGGTSFTGPSPYTGQISILEGPNFDTPIPLVTGLPTSNHDHAVNGIAFDNNGDLLISVGSNTNAGVKHPNSGDLVESPLSAALVKARTSKPGFNGAIQYLLTASGMPSTDQVQGDVVDVAPGVDVHVFAHGLRNAYDIVYTTQGRVLATDNGPNAGFGAASTGPSTEAPDPYDKDEVLLVEYDNYYGSPNRNRGRYDPRQNIYRNGSEPEIPGEFTQTLQQMNSSLDGVDEYRANTFQGQLRGDLVAQRMGSYAYRLDLTPSGDDMAGFSQLTTWSGALGIETLPNGALCVMAQGLNYIRVYVPNDLSAVGLKVHDVTPWRGPETGGTPFVIGGLGFGSPGNTHVFFDGVAATVTSVSPTRIHGITPAHLGHGGGLVTVQVKVGGSTVDLPSAFRFLYPPGGEPGVWKSLANAPTFLGEVAAGVVDGVMYVVGSGGGGTLRYNLTTGAWMSNAPNRPFVGDHHSAEVIGKKLYLIGGLEAGSDGKVQIFDTQTNQWSLGTDMPWAAGSVSTCVIDGMIYAAGGIVGTTTVANHAVYDPVFDTWTALAAMPIGRNHTAATSDGSRFWVIGGRDGANLVANGFDDVQVYDPDTNTWQWSGDGISGLAPLPQARGGMGKAVWMENELYVFGGETATGAGAVGGNVYDRVDVYDPEENTWRLDAPMLHPRHGIFPVRFGARIYVACGGTNAGPSGSNKLDAFKRP